MMKIVFSKNRPLQLHAFISSGKKRWKGGKFTDDLFVIYTCNDFFRRGYEIIQNEFQKENIVWLKENSSDWKRFFISVLSQHITEYNNIVFFCDDNIWVQDWNEKESKEYKFFMKNDSILCYSFRMHPKVICCQPMGDISTPVPESLHDKFFVWQWAFQSGDWGYPFSIDGHVFRKEDIWNLLLTLPYKNVNELEMYLSHRGPAIIKKPYMICNKKPSIVNFPLNRVQDTNPNINLGIDIEKMETLFEKGWRIDTDKLKGFYYRSPHCLMGDFMDKYLRKE